MFNRTTSDIYVSFVIALLLLLHSPALAQEREKQAEQGSKKGAEATEEIEQLKIKVEQLQALLERQQQQMAELLKRVEASESKTPVVAPARADADRLPSVDRAALEIAPRPEAEAIAAQNDPKPKKPASGSERSTAFYTSPDGKFDATIFGLGQFDFRGYQSGTHPPNTYAVRRARLGIQGRFLGSYEYKFEGDFADARGTLLRDFYVGVNRVPWLRFRAGHFREPFSQDRLQPANTIDFVERSLLFNLVTDRSPGIMVFGAINKGTFEYYLGSFNARGLLAANDDGTPESVVRLRTYPLKRSGASWARQLAFGGAYTQGRTRNGLSVGGLTESRSFNFFTPDPVNGKIIRANAEMSWLAGPASFRAEYIQTNEEREGLGAGGANLPGVVGKAYMAQMTYLLTGETKPETELLTPKRNLFGDGSGATGFGAWEIKARYGNLQISDGTPKSNRAETIYFGANWYFNRHVRHMIDFGFERFKDPLRSPKPGDNNFFVVLSRIQVAF